jgi:hypothetical protein
MRAIQISEFGDPAAIQVNDIDGPPAPGRGEVRLDVHGLRQAFRALFSRQSTGSLVIKP